VDPYPRGPDWMPITPKTGSLFHADSHAPRRAIAALAGDSPAALRLVDQAAAIDRHSRASSTT
jgi:hypothetical protein